MALQQQAHAVGANALIEVNVAETAAGSYMVEGDAVVLGDPSLHDLPPGPPPGQYAMPPGPPPGEYAMPSGPPPTSTPAAAPGGWPTPVQQTVGGDDSGWG